MYKHNKLVFPSSKKTVQLGEGRDMCSLLIFIILLLALCVCVEYQYYAASHASSLCGVLVLRSFHKLVKKNMLGVLASGLYH